LRIVVRAIDLPVIRIPAFRHAHLLLVPRRIDCRIQRMFVCRVRLLTGLLLVAGVLFWFGCPTPPKHAPRMTVLDPIDSTPVPQSALETVAVPSNPALPPLRERSGSILPEEPLQLPAGILQLDAWARLCGFQELRILNASFPRSIDLRGDENSLVLTLGHRYAKWNGIQIGLGFLPTVVSGELALNSQDVRKNIYPLAIGAFPALGRNRVLVIDPGHGGADPGSRGSERDAIEKDLTLDWALRMERILTNGHWRVVLTRRQDRNLSLMERVGIADAVQADLFISLHFNSLGETGSARNETGIETFCLTPAGMPSTVNRDFEDDPRRVYPNNQFDSENILLAARLHSALVNSTGRRDRGVKRARFMTVLREQKRPAVLIEGGFLSTAAEARLILQPEYRQQLALALCNAPPE
jgi:N-acetylmuramoyl-L-alanine amidase